MAKKKKAKAGKKQGQKSLRITAELQFAVEFWAAFDRKSDTSFIEDAIEKQADAKGAKHKIDWRAVYHPIEGVRKLRMFVLDPRKHNGDEIRPFALDDEDDARRAFVMMHAPFFYAQRDGQLVPLERNAEVLWPRIDDFLAISTGKDASAWDAGRAMAKALTDREVKPPKWPPPGEAV